jgi:hypothetical protein
MGRCFASDPGAGPHASERGERSHRSRRRLSHVRCSWHTRTLTILLLGCRSIGKLPPVARDSTTSRKRLRGGSPRRRVVAEVARREDGRWSVALRLRSARGEQRRSLTAESCQAAADATALILALAIDQERAAAGTAVRSASTSFLPPPLDRPAVEPEDTEVPGDHASPAVAAVAPTVWWLNASGTVDLGDLPKPEPGAAVSFGARPFARRAFRLGASMSLFAPSEAHAPGPTGGRFWLGMLSASACWEPSLSYLSLGPCLDAGGALLAGSGSGETSTRSRTVPWWMFGAHATVAYRLASSWRLRADAGPAFAVGRPEFLAASTGGELSVIFQPQIVSLHVACGVEALF